MKVKIIKNLVLGLALIAVLIFQACTSDLDVEIIDPDEITAEDAFNDVNAYTQAIAKIYAGLAVSGQQGPAGDGDIKGIDEGFGQYLRGYWQLQELPTDEAIIGWNDGSLQTLNFQTWSSNSEFINALYSRLIYQVSIANEFLREASDEKLDSRGITGEDRNLVEQYRAEARWLRALSYYHALDLFGNVPFITEENPIGNFLPSQATREELFNFIETELLAIEDLMVDARQNQYGRADKAGVWALLAKLYLNAEIYTENPKYTECISYCNKIITGGYSLSTSYQNLFLADNNNNGAQNEIIFAIPFDGAQTQTFGGTTYLVNAAVGGSINRTSLGIPGGGWGGLRTTKNFVYLFDTDANVVNHPDSRAIFYISGQSLEILTISDYTNGFAIIKYKNINADGSPGTTDADRVQVSTDYPVFRLADVYLMYAEAVLRGGTGGSIVTAISYVNALRERAYGNTSANVAGIDLDFILDERARELYWEATRRTDLIRYGRFTGDSYLWPWKGKVDVGASTSSHLNLYPIPSNDLTANPNLEQNPGY